MERCLFLFFKMMLKKRENNLYIISIFQMIMVMNGIINNHKYKNTPKNMK